MEQSLAEKILHQLNYSFNLIRRERYNSGRTGSGVRGQGRLLKLLLRQPVMSQTELSGLLQIRPASVGELVVKLEQKGLVERRSNTQDKRRMDVVLTDAGRDTAMEIADSRHNLAAELVEGFSVAEQLQFADLLDKFVRMLEDKQAVAVSVEKTGRSPRCKDHYLHGGDMGVGEQCEGRHFTGGEHDCCIPRCKDHYHYHGDIGIEEGDGDVTTRFRKYGRHW